MLKNIKQRMKKLGFISIELVIIGSIVLAGGFIGVDKLMKNSTGVMNSLDDASYEQFKATKSELTIKIIGRDHVNYLYDVGENNLTDDDIVQINGIDCYVLKVEDDKAKLLTIDIYDAPFDAGGHSPENVENYVGTGKFADKTYHYKYSTLKTWMDDFYKNELKSDARILNTDVEYRVNSNYPFASTKLYINQYVFPLEYTEARNNSEKFIWNSGSKLKNYFWILYGYKYKSGSEYAVAAAHIGYNNNGNSADVHLSGAVGARPAFWISLD